MLLTFSNVIMTSEKLKTTTMMMKKELSSPLLPLTTEESVVPNSEGTS